MKKMRSKDREDSISNPPNDYTFNSRVFIFLPFLAGGGLLFVPGLWSLL
jgi:hypothetical protein